MRGRKPKPTHLKAVAGNPGKRRLNREEPKPPAGTPERPAALKTKAARAAWDELAPLLEEMGVLTLADTLALTLLCEVYAEWCKTKKATLAARVQSMLAEFGLTPSSRARLKVPPKQGESPLSEFVG